MKAIRFLLLAGLLTSSAAGAEVDVPENFRRENLVAWCIVPFDAKQRGPEERARMLKDLGLTRCAYDWRPPHVSTFEDEILAYREHGIEMFAFWGGHEAAYALFEKHDLHPQVWRTLREGEGETEAEKVHSAADAMEPLAERTAALGCALGLYNHGGWGGRPENLVAVCEELRSRGHDHVGIVYNFHHAHDQIDGWKRSFARMRPYLLCLNLNGMERGGDKAGRKILTIGEGEEEAGMIETVIASGYDGPIGILDHRNETDSAETLRANLEGLDRVLGNRLGEAASASVGLAGRWAFGLPDGRPVWLRLECDREKAWSGSLLWSVGSARPVQSIAEKGGTLHFRRKIRWKPGGVADRVVVIEKPFRARLDKSGDLVLTATQHPAGEPEREETLELTGKRLPPFPDRPDLSGVTFRPSIELIDGAGLDGWELADPKKKNGWRVEDGVLVNETPKEDFGAYGDYGNLVTRREFGDFRLTLEYNVPEGGNSGVYLRGLYEAQVVDRDSRMRGIQGPGAIFGRIAPTHNAAKPGGEWNRYVLTLVDQHVTVELNGEVVIDNVLLEGCTGGGLSADDTAPGPIFLQGDHTSVRYRNIVLEPVAGSTPGTTSG